METITIDFKYMFEQVKTWIITNWEWSIVLFVILIIILRVNIRGYFWSTKSGEKLKLRQFFKSWGKGIEGITYMQQLKMQMWGIWVNVLGLVLGIIVMSVVRPKDLWWWLLIILSAGLFLVIVGLIGVYQKYKIQKKIDQTIKELNTEPKIYDEAGNINKEQFNQLNKSQYTKWKR